MSLQLPLDLESSDRFSRDSFIMTAPLAVAMGVVLHPAQWLSPHLIVQGPPGSGKTHLGHIFATETGATYLTADQTQGPQPPLEDRAYVVDDAERAAQDALFHLINHAQSTGHSLLLLTQDQPLAWPVSVPDLASRLAALRVVPLPEPDEDLLIAILNKLFAQRAISPSPDCVDYIARRMDRSVAAAQKIVTQLEHYANGRPFNRLLARDFFEGQSADLFGLQD